MYVIGTAGHVDHGKSTLIKALTGINPDRLAEEQERQMTIDLGFAWHTLPSGEEVGIVDVPGHRDFIDNMVAGVGGIDLVIFVVAAGEGVMPQSREHFNIVKLLGVQHGLIVLTKIDLVEDKEYLDLVEEEVQDFIKDSFLENAPVIHVSAFTKEGLDELSNAIDELLPKINKESKDDIPRLPIDRVFSLHGFGTIVTGTLIDGSFSVGDQVEILPSGKKSRIRGIQTHKKEQKVAKPGNRTAINLSGVDVQDINRGDVLCLPDTISPTNMLDVECEVLEDYPDALHHDDEVKVFLGTSQKIARVRILGGSEIAPGNTGFVQLMISGRVVARKNDRLILRRPSPAATIGGGVVLNAFPTERHKRFVPEVIKRLKIHANGSDEERVLMAIADLGIADTLVLREKTSFSEDKIQKLLMQIKDNGLIQVWEDTIEKDKQWFVTMENWARIKEKTTAALQEFHHLHPLKKGVDQKFIQTVLSLDKQTAQAVIRFLISDGVISAEEHYLKIPGFTIQLTSDQQQLMKDVLNQFNKSGYQTPSVKDIIEITGDELFQFLVESGKLKMVTNSVLFIPKQIEILIKETIEILDQKEKITVADFRDHFKTSRKYAVAMLEYMDDQKITIRKDDFRIKNIG